MPAHLATLDRTQTAAVLPYPALVKALIHVAQEKAQGKISTPARQALAFPTGGTLLSMPATAHDIGVHKLVNVMPHNAAQGEPVIQGLVCAYDGHTGAPLFVLDGPTVTERRTAALSMMGIELLWQQPKHVTLIGSGVQAYGHAEALLTLYPQATISLLARQPHNAQKLIERLGSPHTLQAVQAVPSDSDVVITVTSSSKPVYSETALLDRLVIAVGAYTPEMAEIHPATVQGSDIFVDNSDAARQEAGDLIQARVNWAAVQPLYHDESHRKHQRPLLYKTIGCAAWDLAAARCARVQREIVL
ncbi:delta(1)-pyrroline-2-carboxylate reductase family protein [Paenalcaligenes hominis]|uniref:delta(1)-pyrroline-2-carboxylate reductase family protein n=1 Tax=Paenalcaligenes hominis TaxID=643674 RepID=UPI0035256332